MQNETETLNAYQLARLADCLDPDSTESPGAQFLARVQDDYREAIEDERYDEDETPHEIADGAVPIYTHDRWMTFADLGAYQEDVTEFGPIEDMTDAAGVALYMIAQRLVYALAQADES